MAYADVGAAIDLLRAFHQRRLDDAAWIEHLRQVDSIAALFRGVAVVTLHLAAAANPDDPGAVLDTIEGLWHLASAEREVDELAAVLDP